MLFEVINRDGRVEMNTEYKSELPTKSEVKSMYENGFKIRIDGKIATKKKVDELLKR